MNPDQMPKNSQRDEGVDVFEGLPSAAEMSRRTAKKRQELAGPFEKAVVFTRKHAAERIAHAADRGQTEAKVEGGEIKNVVKNIAARRVLGQVCEELERKGFRAHVAGGDFTWDTTLEIRWSCDTPDYRTSGD